MKRALLVVLLLAGCGSGGDGRQDMCGRCSYPEGSCATVEKIGHALCEGGHWRLVQDGQPCAAPVCSVYQGETYRGEEPWCHWAGGDCR